MIYCLHYLTDEWTPVFGSLIRYISKSEVCSPEFFQENGDKGFLDNFFGGLLTTSGLSNLGTANEDEGVKYGLHGTISNIPASNVAVEKVWKGDDYLLTIRRTEIKVGVSEKLCK